MLNLIQHLILFNFTHIVMLNQVQHDGQFSLLSFVKTLTFNSNVIFVEENFIKYLKLILKLLL